MKKSSAPTQSVIIPAMDYANSVNLAEWMIQRHITDILKKGDETRAKLMADFGKYKYSHRFLENNAQDLTIITEAEAQFRGLVDEKEANPEYDFIGAIEAYTKDTLEGLLRGNHLKSSTCAMSNLVAVWSWKARGKWASELLPMLKELDKRKADLLASQSAA